MPKCKDCVHSEICTNHLKAVRGIYGAVMAISGREVNRLESALSEISITIGQIGCDGCDHFQDRSRFVELPCKVGDKVYLDNLHIKYADVIGIYIDAFGGVLDLRVFTNVPIPNGFGYEHFISKDYTFEDIGKRIFLTREEAEKALKERENNENQ